MNFPRLITTMLLCIGLALPAVAGAVEKKTPSPGPRDKCPVCGMFTAKYPDWLATITFRDGTTVFFDGPKDLITYYLDPAKFSPGKRASDIAAVQVKDYYELKPIDGRTAFYVLGSNVNGPMGKEAIPFSKESDAREFMKDHKGKKIARLSELTRDILKQFL